MFNLFLEKTEEPEIIDNICWIIENAREFQKNIYFCFIDYAKSFDCVDHNKLWEILKEMGGSNFSLYGTGMQSRKRRNTWSNRQIWPWSIEWSRAKANRVLSREHASHSKHPLSTTQEKTLHMDITRRSILKSDWLYSLQQKMEKLYAVSKNKTRSWLWLRSWTPYRLIHTYIEESRENHWTVHVWPKSNTLCLYSGSDR